MSGGARGGTRGLDVSITGRHRSIPRDLAAWLARVAPRRAVGLVSVALVTDARMRVLNRRYRRHDQVTDVLSFPAGKLGQLTATSPDIPILLGDIAIATGRAQRQAREQGHTAGTEIKILALHGLLHLLGYDHERDRGQMRALEERLRRRGRVPTGLIARSRRPAR
jgi:probable rRNA maturation factor